ncbi:MAG TPA: DUF3471 domain-containing protein, partial [Planctomycetota bacterium]|nr:DUF3471 domain-containing protein [Planctomycetota bacterium]
MRQERSSLYPAMQLAHKNSRAPGSVPVVGLGWHTAVAGDLEIVWHNGGTGGYRTFIGFVKGREKGVVVLSNAIFSVDDIGMHVLNPASPLVPIEKFRPDGKTVSIDSTVLEKHVGQYELAPALILTITREENQLKAQLSGQPAFPVYAKFDNVYYYKVVSAQLTFNRNNEGKTESVTLLQGGQQLIGKRVK